jgi:MFS family permease
MGVPPDQRLAFIGLFTSLLFIVGAPLVPLWGVWADKYSRKAVIIRSAMVEAVVLAAVALSREPWQLALSLLLVGFQLGNTGVMLAAIRDVSPRRLLGTTIGIFAASSPIGFALGPIVGGLLVDVAGLELSGVFLVSAALSLATAGLVALTHEIRPSVVPQGRVLALAFGALRSVLTDPSVRRIFAIYFVAFLANQMTRPYTPVLVEDLVGPMVFGLLATEVPPERRSATLNLVYLPLYAAGIIGPATGAVVASAVGVAGPYIAGALALTAGALAWALATRHRRPGSSAPGPAPGSAP